MIEIKFVTAMSLMFIAGYVLGLICGIEIGVSI